MMGARPNDLKTLKIGLEAYYMFATFFDVRCL